MICCLLHASIYLHNPDAIVSHTYCSLGVVVSGVGITLFNCPIRASLFPISCLRLRQSLLHLPSNLKLVDWKAAGFLKKKKSKIWIRNLQLVMREGGALLPWPNLCRRSCRQAISIKRFEPIVLTRFLIPSPLVLKVISLHTTWNHHQTETFEPKKNGAPQITN